ncbi:MAG: ABC transporter ATP-binding protein, partial [Bacteroidales bacterium]|nr:ABC transporter ATP-binding protein [Bacteroidales bacterium]
MKAFWKMLREYVAPYRKYLWWSVLLNILSVIFNLFSFSMIMPILKMLFNMDVKEYTLIPWDQVSAFDSQALINNLYYYVAQFTGSHGASRTLLLLCLFLCVMTVFKTACYFGASAVMIPIRTGVVKDMRKKIYDKILSLPIGYFSQERKGDIIARMSGDVQEVENSVTGVLDMFVKNPILIIGYFAAMVIISWQLTLFTIVFAPVMLWLMGAIGRKLKEQSLEAQALWSDTMSQVEETLGGLRVIKAFLAEKKMSRRFLGIIDNMRVKTSRVATRQASAHPVSECLGTFMIAVVLWFGGSLILKDNAPIDAPTFIFFMVILYSIIAPIKDLSKAAYSIPKGMASMERINKILESGNPIQDAPDAVEIHGLDKGISFDSVFFRYPDGNRDVLNDINLEIEKGKTIAIVGASGAGKSTLADLIPRFYDITGGCISIDGKDIRKVKIASLRSLMGNVNQDPILFNDTIFNNIAFGVEHATREEVIAAAKIANAHDF